MRIWGKCKAFESKSKEDCIFALNFGYKVVNVMQGVVAYIV